MFVCVCVLHLPKRRHLHNSFWETWYLAKRYISVYLLWNMNMYTTRMCTNTNKILDKNMKNNNISKKIFFHLLYLFIPGSNFINSKRKKKKILYNSLSSLFLFIVAVIKLKIVLLTHFCIFFMHSYLIYFLRRRTHCYSCCLFLFWICTFNAWNFDISNMCGNISFLVSLISLTSVWQKFWQSNNVCIVAKIVMNGFKK